MRPCWIGDKADAVKNWLSRIWNFFSGPAGPETVSPRRDLDATDDFPSPSSISLAPAGLKLRVGVVSTVGNYRPHNEDNFFVPGRRSVVQGGSTENSLENSSSTLDVPPTQAPSPDSHEPVTPLFIVADGMGGQQAGEEASRMAVEIIPKAVRRRLPAEESDPRAIQAAVRDAVADANQEILGASGTVSEYEKMGTTVVLVLFRNDRAFVAGVGDSRAYRLRAGQLDQLTQDHSLADALVTAGTITKEELPNHKFKNILYLYLGCKEARGGPEEVRVLDVRPGDRFLLASDGLTGVVRDEILTGILAACDDPQKAAKLLKDQALASDSRDNITCLVIHVISGVNAPAPGPPDAGS